MAPRQVDHLLIGGGVAAASCAEALRVAGAEGSILLVGREVDPPYHRPPLSKGYLGGREDRTEALIHPAEWYGDHRIDLLSRTSVTKLDPAGRTATLSTREEVTYGTALLATGANVRRLNVEGAQLEGIHYLRAFGNADAIRQDAAGRRVVLVGGSYLACEVAATLTAAGSQCTLVMLEDLPLSRGFGPLVGRWCADRLTEHGITWFGGEALERFEGAGERVTHVVTQSGRRLEADAVVMGTGALPDVMLARAAGLELGDSGGVRVDAQLRTPAPGLFAAGDVAEYDSRLHGGPRRIEHWDVAIRQGRAAAHGMLGDGSDYTEVPYFFSDLGDWAALEYVGPVAVPEREIVRGRPADGAFSVWHLTGDRLVGALGVGRPEDLAAARELISSGRAVDRPEMLADLSSDPADLTGDRADLAGDPPDR